MITREQILKLAEGLPSRAGMVILDPKDVLELLDEVEALKEEIKELTEENFHLDRFLEKQNKEFEALATFDSDLGINGKSYSISKAGYKEEFFGHHNESCHTITGSDGSKDTAHLGPFTTVRACVDCGVLISGGPVRCKYCGNEEYL